MKSLSDNLLVFALALVLGLSPLQGIAASVSNCMDSNKTMHHQMTGSKMMMSANMSESATQHDCCEETACDMYHCATTTAVLTSVTTFNDMTYTVSNVQLKPAISLIQFYPSSLYRPPKV